uniref:Uncharacterized protein n=1 Tax=Periophthalmus magnuspinnatus TaxID=409849 RepID=A0A3B3ZI69_9GOBI
MSCRTLAEVGSLHPSSAGAEFTLGTATVASSSFMGTEMDLDFPTVTTENKSVDLRVGGTSTTRGLLRTVIQDLNWGPKPDTQIKPSDNDLEKSASSSPKRIDFVPVSPAPSPTRGIGKKQCFSPSLQILVSSNGLTPSPIPSPTRRFSRRSQSPINCIRPGILGPLKRKGSIHFSIFSIENQIQVDTKTSIETRYSFEQVFHSPDLLDGSLSSVGSSTDSPGKMEGVSSSSNSPFTSLQDLSPK